MMAVGPDRIFLEHGCLVHPGHSSRMQSIQLGGRQQARQDSGAVHLTPSPLFCLLTQRYLVLEVLISWSLASLCILSSL